LFWCSVTLIACSLIIFGGVSEGRPVAENPQGRVFCWPDSSRLPQPRGGPKNIFQVSHGGRHVQTLSPRGVTHARVICDPIQIHAAGS
jgi:hypothetical protein